MCIIWDLSWIKKFLIVMQTVLNKGIHAKHKILLRLTEVILINACVCFFLTAVNACYLGKNGAISHLFRILSLYGRKYLTHVRCTLDTLALLVRSSEWMFPVHSSNIHCKTLEIRPPVDLLWFPWLSEFSIQGFSINILRTGQTGCICEVVIELAWSLCGGSSVYVVDGRQ